MAAAWLMIWSSASSEKLIVISSTTGRNPAIAPPTPTPTIVFSEIGVSRTRLSPNSPSRPCVHLLAEHVEVVVQRVELRERARVGEPHCLVHGRDCLAVELLQVLLGEHAVIDEPLREAGDRVAPAPLLHLVLRAVLLRVGHRMA